MIILLTYKATKTNKQLEFFMKTFMFFIIYYGYYATKNFTHQINIKKLSNNQEIFEKEWKLRKCNNTIIQHMYISISN